MNEKKKEERFIEFSILVEQDLADLVGNVLMEILPTGLVAERVYDGVFPHELDQVTGPVRIFGFFPVDQEEEYREAITLALEELRVKIELPEPVFSSLENKNWAAAWQERYHPIPLGDQLIIVPSWLENPDPERIPIFIDPGMAFGSGTHETTQLSLVLIEKSLSDRPAAEMIDIGCGSGILSIAAAKLGVKKVLGVDTDPEAIRVSGENGIKNRVKSAATFAAGSVNEILSGALSLSQAPLVVANIIAPILEELFADGLGELVPEAGRLILSGMLEEQLPTMLNCLDLSGFIVQTRLQQGEWVGLVAEKSQG